jgi:hypothetical protein
MGHLLSTTLLILTLGHDLWRVASYVARYLAPLALYIISTPVADMNFGEGNQYLSVFFSFALIFVLCYELGNSLLSGTKDNCTM